MNGKHLLSAVLAAAVIFSSVGTVAAETAAEKRECDFKYSAPLSSEKSVSYDEYCSGLTKFKAGENKNRVSAKYLRGGSSSEINGEKAFFADDGQSLEFSADISESGWYEIELTYFSGLSDGFNTERGISIDGKLPYSEADSVTLFGVWKDENGKTDGRRFKTDSQGNELLGDSKESEEAVTVRLRDSGGYINTPLRFYLEKGSHTVGLTPVSGSAAVRELVLAGAEDIPNYEEYKNKNSAAPVKDFLQTAEAENYSAKSNSDILCVNDRTSAATSPQDPSEIRLNTVGGTSWSTNGRWIEWEITVPETAAYRIGLRYRQNFLSGMLANRRLLIDGEVPFTEAEYITFSYGSAWKTAAFGNENGDYLFYLTAGKHTLRIECALGESAELLGSAEEIVSSFGTAYEKLIMYMGNDPDVNRDYKVEQMLPEVPEILHENVLRLESLSKSLIAFSGERGNANVAIDNLYDCVKRMYDDSRDIPALLSAFRDYQAALSSWIQTQSSQSLQIDYIFIAGTENGVPKAGAGFIKSSVYKIKSFLASFSTDYSQMTGSNEEKIIEVWVNTGRDQAQIIRNMISDKFSPATGIGVNLKLVSGQLLLATMAGVGPDVSLFNTAADVMNFAYRNAAEPLEGYDGFADKRELFAPSAWTPVSAGGHTYAIPEQQSFFVMFYRSDILSGLGLKLPENRAELYTVIGELQRNNLEFGFPNSVYSFGTLLYQNGGSFYNEEHTATDLTSSCAIDTFREWTRLYTNYGIPYEYSDVNRFRSGEMPLLIGDYTLYNNISVSAPEIKGKWGFATLPGNTDKDGNTNRLAATGTIGCMMMSSGDSKNEAWQFIDWWTETETQSDYAINLENILGVSARYCSANIEVLSRLPWKSAEYAVIKAQLECSAGIPEIPGSYYLARYLENAFRRVVNYREDERETLITYAKQIDEEIAYKSKELGR